VPPASSFLISSFSSFQSVEFAWFFYEVILGFELARLYLLVKLAPEKLIVLLGSKAHHLFCFPLSLLNDPMFRKAGHLLL